MKMPEQSTTPDLVALTRRTVELASVRITNYADLDEGRAAAERLAAAMD
jgi:hypothetical protein